MAVYLGTSGVFVLNDSERRRLIAALEAAIEASAGSHRITQPEGQRMRHRWGEREERAVPWSAAPVGQYRCQRPGCDVIKTTEPDGMFRRTVYLEGQLEFGKAPACQGEPNGKNAKEQSAG